MLTFKNAGRLTTPAQARISKLLLPFDRPVLWLKVYPRRRRWSRAARSRGADHQRHRQQQASITGMRSPRVRSPSQTIGQLEARRSSSGTGPAKMTLSNGCGDQASSARNQGIWRLRRQAVPTSSSTALGGCARTSASARNQIVDALVGGDAADIEQHWLLQAPGHNAWRRCRRAAGESGPAPPLV